MTRIEALESVLLEVRENASDLDRQAIDAVLAVGSDSAGLQQLADIATLALAYIYSDPAGSVGLTDAGRKLVGPAMPDVALVNQSALDVALARAADSEALATYLHGRVVMYGNLYKSLKKSLPGAFKRCNCGYAGPLRMERCGQDGKAFAARCPDCNKSVQAFSEAALPVNWNAVNRKYDCALPAEPIHS